MLLGVDVGGTFTDAVLVGSDRVLHSAKVPSTPSEESVGVMQAVRLVLQAAGAVARRRRALCARHDRRDERAAAGAPARTALIATAGFTDVIELGRQARVSLYRLCEAAPAPLVSRELRFGAPERMGHDGPLQALDPSRARELVERVALAEPQAVAVALLHSYADDSHELLLGELVRELMPGVQLSLSSDLVGTFREYERTATTVLDGALSPPLSGYLRSLTEQARAMDLVEPEVMQSSGGLTDAARAGAHAALTVLSGPAGGVGGALLLAELAGEQDVLCFDMGGTSCDVCVIEASQVAETAERVIAGRPLSLPALDIHTVGAGGGSIAWQDAGGALRVGPRSAGARPGPACYGRGGTEPTVTDANLLLGQAAGRRAAGRRPSARQGRRRAGGGEPGRRSGHGRRRLRRGHRAGRRERDARGAAADDGRARGRPPRLRADAVRRRRAAACRIDGARAGHLEDPLPPRRGSALRTRAGGRRAAAGRRQDADARPRLDQRRAAHRRALLARRAGRRSPRLRADGACVPATSCATAASPSSWRSRRSSRAARGLTRRRCARPSRARTSSATATAMRRPRWSS